MTLACHHAANSSFRDRIKTLLPIEVLGKNTQTRKAMVEDAEGKKQSLGVCLAAFLFA